jgi:hypothetical protein
MMAVVQRAERVAPTLALPVSVRGAVLGPRAITTMARVVPGLTGTADGNVTGNLDN